MEVIKANGFGDQRMFDELNRLMGMGEFRVHIAQTFPLEEAAQAQEAMNTHYLGKIVLSVGE